MNNSIIPQQAQQQFAVTYMAGNTEIRLDEGTVFNYLVSGNKNSVTQQEIVLFMKMCEHQGLNPFLKETYLVKYSASDSAQHIIGKGALEKRAFRNPRYKGIVGGIIVRRGDGQIDYRVGEFYLPEEKIVGGWAKVFVDGYHNPIEASVAFAEYNTGKSIWAKKPATMIHKVATMHALRSAFPEELAGMYIAEEVDAHDLPDAPAEQLQQGTQNVIETEIAPPPMEQPEFADFSELMGG